MKLVCWPFVHVLGKGCQLLQFTVPVPLRLRLPAVAVDGVLGYLGVSGYLDARVRVFRCSGVQLCTASNFRCLCKGLVAAVAVCVCLLQRCQRQRGLLLCQRSDLARRLNGVHAWFSCGRGKTIALY
jgi:hypothetical protein